MQDDASLYLRWLEARDQDAFATLARRRASLVIDVALRVGVDRGVAEDALQDALLALAQDGTARPATVGVRAWLARAALSKALNMRASERSRRGRERKVGQTRAETTMDADRVDAREAVVAALGRCGGADAALLSLRFIHGFEYPELASVLDVADATARVRVHRALGRLREDMRGDEFDGRALAGLLTAVPPHTASALAVAGAIASALADMGVATAPATAGTVPVRGGVTPWRALGIAGAAVLAVGLGILLWQVAMSGDVQENANAPRVASAPQPPAGATLRGRTGLPPDASAHAGPLPAAGGSPPGHSAHHPPPRPIPVPAGAQAVRPPRTPVAVRMELVRSDGSTEEIEDFDVSSGPYQFTAKGLREHPGALRTRSDRYIGVSTNDPRVAIRTVGMRVPHPIPSVLTFHVPEKGDPRLSRLTLEVVDASTGMPLPDAVLEWGVGANAASQRADATGHIVAAYPDASAPGASQDPALQKFEDAEWCVQAPGHKSIGHRFGWHRKEFVPSVDAKVLAQWLATGIRHIALPSLADVPGLEERRVRVVDAEGRPAEGVFVYVVWPGLVKLPAWPESCDGFRHLGSDGLLRLAIRDVVGIEARVGRVPIAAWALAKSDWPATGPREIRMPPVATAELVLEGVPAGRKGHWWRDPLGAKRTPYDGPAFPPMLDASAAQILAERDLMLPLWLRDVGGEVEAPRTTMRLPLATGRAHTIHLYLGTEHRLWTLRPDAAGPLRLVRRWKDLPLAP